MDIELLLYTNIDLKLRNKLHGPMHCKIGGTCVYNGHVFILSCYNTTIYSTYFQFSSRFNEFMSVWSIFTYNIMYCKKLKCLHYNKQDFNNEISSFTWILLVDFEQMGKLIQAIIINVQDVLDNGTCVYAHKCPPFFKRIDVLVKYMYGSVSIIEYWHFTS